MKRGLAEEFRLVWHFRIKTLHVPIYVLGQGDGRLPQRRMNDAEQAAQAGDTEVGGGADQAAVENGGQGGGPQHARDDETVCQAKQSLVGWFFWNPLLGAAQPITQSG